VRLVAASLLDAGLGERLVALTSCDLARGPVTSGFAIGHLDDRLTTEEAIRGAALRGYAFGEVSWDEEHCGTVSSA